MSSDGLGLFRALVDFRPSCRALLLDALSTQDRVACVDTAIRMLVAGWETSDWIDDYSLEVRGRWLGRNAPQNFSQSILSWCQETGSVARAAMAGGIQNGIKVGVSVAP